MKGLKRAFRELLESGSLSYRHTDFPFLRDELAKTDSSLHALLELLGAEAVPMDSSGRRAWEGAVLVYLRPKEGEDGEVARKKTLELLKHHALLVHFLALLGIPEPRHGDQIDLVTLRERVERMAEREDPLFLSLLRAMSRLLRAGVGYDRGNWEAMLKRTVERCVQEGLLRPLRGSSERFSVEPLAILLHSLFLELVDRTGLGGSEGGQP